MSQFCKDSFTDTAGTALSAHTGEVGATWTAVPTFSGAAVINPSGDCRGNGANALWYESGLPASADYDVEADVYVASIVNQAGILGRVSTTAATYYLLYYDAGAAVWRLYVVVNGTAVTNFSFAQTLTAGQIYHLHLMMRGSQIMAFVNGSQIFNVTDSNISAAGRAGVYFSAADTNTTGLHLRNFSGATAASDGVTDANIYFSPYNWKSDGGGSMQSNNVNASSTYALSNNTGAYLKFTLSAVTQGSVTMLLDTTPMNGVSAGNCPTIDILVDGKAFTTTLLAYATGTTRILLADNLAAGNHTFEVFFKSVDLSSTSSMGDRWNGSPPQAVVKVTGFELDGKGSATASQTLAAKRMIWFGDSFAEGGAIVANGYINADNDATQTMPQLVAAGLNAEVGVIGFATQGFGNAGYGNVPMLYNSTDASQSWNKYYASNSRLVSGSFTPAPDYIVVMEGTNDQNFGISDATVTTAVQSLISAWRTAAPNARIFVCIPPNGDKRSAITTGVSNAADSKTTLIDLGTASQNTLAGGGLNTNDGTHPNVRGHATFAAMLLNAMQAVLGGSAASFAASTGNFVGGEVQLTDGAFAV